MQQSLTAASAVSLATVVLAAAVAGARSGPSVNISPPLSGSTHAGDVLVVSGRVHPARNGARAELELKRTTTWRAVARSAVSKAGAFKIRWRIPRSAAGFVSLRVAEVSAHKLLAASRSQSDVIGQAPVYCAPAKPPPSVPAGDGWIEGGRYIEGGPAPGIYDCSSQSYTVTAKNQTGSVRAIQTVAAGKSYTLVVPAGRYSLASDSCFGSADVLAGKLTVANTNCLVP